MATKSRPAAIADVPADVTGEIPPEFRADQSDDQADDSPREYVTPTSATPAKDTLLAFLESRAISDDEGAYDGMEDIIAEVLGAANGADVLRKRLPAAMENYVGVPFLLERFKVRHSDIEDGKGLPYYIVCDVQMGEPVEPRVLTTSSWKIVAQVAALENLGELPKIVVIEEVRAAKKGQSAPLTLVTYQPE